MVESRTYRPSRRRLRRARERGLVARSGLLTSAVVLVGGGLALGLGSGGVVGGLMGLMRRVLGSLETAEPAGTLALGLATGLEAIAPFLGAVFGAAVLASLAQVGPLLAPGAVKPDAGRLAPGAGLRRLLARERRARGFTTGLAAVGLAVLTFGVLARRLPVLARLPQVELGPGLVAVARALEAWTAGAVGLLLGVGALDLVLQRRQLHRRLMMTRSEVERERREQEGDPVYRAERKRLHRELLEFDFERAVRSATLLVARGEVTAAALYWDEHSDEAPELLAKGRGKAASTLLELAESLGVPSVQAAELADELQRLRIGERVPERLYRPVARAIRRSRSTGGSAEPGD